MDNMRKPTDRTVRRDRLAIAAVKLSPDAMVLDRRKQENDLFWTGKLTTNRGRKRKDKRRWKRKENENGRLMGEWREAEDEELIGSSGSNSMTQSQDE